MNLFKFFNWFSGNANRQASGDQVTGPSTTAHEDTTRVSIDSALQISTVWACIDLLVESLSSLPVIVYQETKGGREKAKDELIYDIFHRSPNRIQTSQEFWETMFLNFFFRGNAYARIQKNKLGEPVALWPLSADQVRVKVVESRVFYFYHFDNKEYIYDESDILHIKGKGNGIVGLSLLEHMGASCNVAIKAQNHTNATYRKDARRPGVLMSEKVLTKEQREALKQNLSGLVTGGKQELHILEADFKFEALGMSPSDIQLLETRKFSVQDLARWFGVPSVLVNDTGETTSLGSSITQILDGFYRLKLRPQLTRVEQAIHKRVFTPKMRARRLSVEFNLDALLRANIKDRMEVYSKGTQNGVYTRNECRQKENLPPVKGGDKLTVQSNMMSIENIDKVVPGSGKASKEQDQPIEQ